MAHLNLYIPDQVEKKIKAAAKKRGKSISAFILEIVSLSLGGNKAKWSPEFLTILEKGIEDIEEQPDPPIQNTEGLDDISS